MNAPPPNQPNITNPSLTTGGLSNTLSIFDPLKFMVFLTFISPILLIATIVSLSFVFQNFKGLIYLGFLIGVVLLREFMFYKNSNYEKAYNDGTICSAIQFSYIGNTTFSIFVSCFTFLYLSFPMFINQDVNWSLTAILIFYIVFDIGVKMAQGCINLRKQGVQLFLDMLMGLAFAAIITSLMYAGGSSKYLFFNELSTEKAIYNTPKQQQFKCAVYKNGELLGEA